MEHEQRPLSDFEQGILFAWMRANSSLYEADKLRKDFPQIGVNIFGPSLTHNIPTDMFNHLKSIYLHDRLEAVKVLRNYTEWNLKEASDFCKTYFSS